jgi:hypothetical protein
MLLDHPIAASAIHAISRTHDGQFSIQQGSEKVHSQEGLLFQRRNLFIAVRNGRLLAGGAVKLAVNDVGALIRDQSYKS